MTDPDAAITLARVGSRDVTEGPVRDRAGAW